MNEIITLEHSLIAFCLIDSECAATILRYIKPSSLIDDRNKSIFSKIQSLYAKNEPIDAQSVAKESKVDILTIMEIQDSQSIHQKKNIDKYIDKWIELRKKHYLKNIDLKKMAEESSAEDIKNTILKTMEFSRSKIDVVKIKDAVLKTKDYILAGDTNILKTGYLELDKAVKIRDTNLIVVAASPKTGKTTFVLNIANYIAQKKKCLFFSFEMSIEEITKKMVSIKSNRPINSVADFNFNSDRVNDLDFNIVESAGMSIPEIKSVIIDQQPSVVFIDQLDCIPVDGSTERHDLRLGKNVVDLKKISMELKVPIFLIHQLNRDAMKQTTPQLFNLKDSAIVEQKADIVMMLWRDKTTDDYNKQKETVLKIGANRMGVECSLEYYYDFYSGVFDELSKGKPEEEICPF
ncbi:MAG TPA: DnaB-like helicase C-terminal domain-containing protein [Candidatus Pacearchaeota archaeon]|nr:DnaB-like helicase C-terminal domain-containing protein [Candidatus Pacearchaeota archaeon]